MHEITEYMLFCFFVKKQGSKQFSSNGRVKIFSSESRKSFVKKQPHRPTLLRPEATTGASLLVFPFRLSPSLFLSPTQVGKPAEEAPNAADRTEPTGFVGTKKKGRRKGSPPPPLFPTPLGISFSRGAGEATQGKREKRSSWGSFLWGRRGSFSAIWDYLARLWKGSYWTTKLKNCALGLGIWQEKACLPCVQYLAILNYNSVLSLVAFVARLKWYQKL